MNQIFESDKIINKIHDGILYENDANLREAENSISALQECDKRDFIQARLAFIKLYPVPHDFVSFKELISCLEDASDERNPIHWLNKLADGVAGKNDYVNLCNRFKQSVILAGDTYGKGETYPLSQKYEKKPRTKQSTNSPYDKNLKNTNLWAVDAYPNHGAKHYYVGDPVSMYNHLQGDKHAYEHLQTTHCHSGGDKSCRFYLDIDGDNIKEEIVWKETLYLVFKKLFEVFKKEGVLLYPEMMAVLSAHNKDMNKMSYHLHFPMAPVLFESIGGMDQFMKKYKAELTIGLDNYGLSSGSIPKIDMRIYNDRPFRMVNQSKWKENPRVLTIRNGKQDELSFLIFNMLLIQGEKLNNQYYLNVESESIAASSVRKRRKVNPAVPETIYNDEIRTKVIEILKKGDYERLNKVTFGELRRINEFCYALKLVSPNNYCPVGDWELKENLSHGEQYTHNASIKITPNKCTIACFGNCIPVECNTPLQMKHVLFPNLPTDKVLVYFQEGVSMYDFLKVDSSASLQEIKKKINAQRGSITLWVTLRAEAEQFETKDAFIQSKTNTKTDKKHLEKAWDDTQRPNWTERRRKIDNLLDSCRYIVGSMNQNDLYSIFRVLTLEYPDSWQHVWNELSINQLYVRYVLSIIEDKDFIRIHDTVSQWNDNKKCYVKDWANDENDSTLDSFITWINNKNEKIKGVYGRIRDTNNLKDLLRNEWKTTVIKMRYYGFINGIYDRDTRIFYAYDKFTAIDSKRVKKYNGQKFICYKYYDREFEQAADPVQIEGSENPFDKTFHGTTTIVDIILESQKLPPCDIFLVYACIGRCLYLLKEKDEAKCCIYLLGESNTGKSIILYIIQLFHREEYAVVFAAKGHQRFGFDYEGYHIAIHPEAYETNMDSEKFKTLVEGGKTTKAVACVGDIQYTVKACTVMAGNPEEGSTKDFKYIKDNKNGVSNRLILVPFDHQIDEQSRRQMLLKKYPDMQLGASEAMLKSMFDETKSSCRHLPIILERSLYAYNLFCEELKKKSYWYELLNPPSVILQRRMSNLLDLKKFMEEWFDVNKKMSVNELRVVRKTKDKIKIHADDEEKNGLRYRGKPKDNEKCDSMYYEDFIETYEYFTKSKPKNSKLERYSYSNLVHVLHENDILLRKIDFSDSVKKEKVYIARGERRGEERLNWVLFGIKPKMTNPSNGNPEPRIERTRDGNLCLLKKNGFLVDRS